MKSFFAAFIFILILYTLQVMVGLYWRSRFNSLSEWTYVYDAMKKERGMFEDEF